MIFFQRKNLINNKETQIEINNLRNILSEWKSETGDSNPDQITKHWYKKDSWPIKSEK